jgi:hypothetical protein
LNHGASAPEFAQGSVRSCGGNSLTSRVELEVVIGSAG